MNTPTRTIITRDSRDGEVVLHFLVDEQWFSFSATEIEAEDPMKYFNEAVEAANSRNLQFSVFYFSSANRLIEALLNTKVSVEEYKVVYVLQKLDNEGWEAVLWSTNKEHILGKLADAVADIANEYRVVIKKEAP